MRPRRHQLVVAFTVAALTAAQLSVAVGGAEAATGARTAPDAGLIAFSTGFILPPEADLSVDAQIFTVHPDGTHERQLTHSAAGIGSGDPAFSPDGSRIAYASNVDGPFGIWVMNADGSHQHQILTAPNTTFFQPSWSPDGSRLVVVACDTSLGFAAWCDLDTVRSDGTGRTALVKGQRFHSFPAYSPDGRTIAFASDRAGLLSAIWLIGTDGRGLRRVTRANLEAFAPSWSPDGSHIAFTKDCCRADSQVFVMRADGSDVVQVTHVVFPRQAGGAAYSADGRHLVFVSDLLRPAQSGNDILVMRPDGTGIHRIVSDQPNAFLMAWGR